MKRLMLALLLASCAGPTLSPGPLSTQTTRRYAPQTLETVADIVQAAAASGNRPVVVFDLDDTLFDARTRTLPIVHELAQNGDFRQHHPKAATSLESAKLTDMRYDLDRVFSTLKIEDPAALQKAKPFWEQRFFSNPYAVKDSPLIGAAAYVRRLHDLGATIVYLTGRDTPRMTEGTKESLKKHGFPLGKRAELVLKPHSLVEDLEFKRNAFRLIEQKGAVVAYFENEPRNLNALGEYFPTAVGVFVDSQHSSKPEVPSPKAAWIKDYGANP